MVLFLHIKIWQFDYITEAFYYELKGKAFGVFENWKMERCITSLVLIVGQWPKPQSKSDLRCFMSHSIFSFGGLVMRQGFLWNYFWYKKNWGFAVCLFRISFQNTWAGWGVDRSLIWSPALWIWILICGVVGGITYSFTRESHLEWNKINVLSPNSLSDLSQFISIKLP